MKNTNGLSVVLVHGGWVDGSGWEGVHNILTRDGHHVSIVQIPTLSLADDVMATRYMVAMQDHAIPPATERFMAHRAHASIVEVDASHVAMISQPEATTRLILDATDSLR